MAIAKPFERPNPECRYVRDIGGKWEYGLVTREKMYDKPRHEALGVRDTYEEACSANNMATKGYDPLPYGGYPCFGRY